MFFYLWFVLLAVKAICDFQWLHVSHVECLINSFLWGNYVLIVWFSNDHLPYVCLVIHSFGQRLLVWMKSISNLDLGCVHLSTDFAMRFLHQVETFVCVNDCWLLLTMYVCCFICIISWNEVQIVVCSRWRLLLWVELGYVVYLVVLLIEAWWHWLHKVWSYCCGTKSDLCDVFACALWTVSRRMLLSCCYPYGSMSSINFVSFRWCK
jgi:hypothetical protein